MAERDFGEVINRYVKTLTERENTLNARVQARNRAMRKVERMLKDRSTAHKKERVKEHGDEIQQWREKTFSQSYANKMEAETQALQDRYGNISLAEARDNLAETTVALQRRGLDVPDWLQAGGVQHTWQGIEYVTRVSELSAIYRGKLDSPEYADRLLYESSKLYWSVEWHGMSDDALAEVHGLLERTFYKTHDIYSNPTPALHLGPISSPDSFSEMIESFDVRPDFARTHRFDPVVSVGDPPDVINPVTHRNFNKATAAYKATPEYQAWVASKVNEAQARRLINTIESYQKIFDLPANFSLNNQREQLDNLIKALRNGINTTQSVSGIDGEYSQFNSDEATRYIDAAQARFNKLNIALQEQSNLQRQEQYGEQVVTLGDLRKKDWFLADELSKTTQGLGDEVSMSFGRQWTKQDVDFLLKNGYRKWFYRYADRVFGLGTERKQPSLAEQYMYEDFRNFLITFYGGNEASYIVQEFQIQWEERSRYDFIIHSLGLGPGDMKRRLEAMSMLQSSDLDYLNTFKYSELAFSFMERETFDLMGEKLAEYEKRVKWLEAEIKNDFYSNDTTTLTEKLKTTFPEKSQSDVDKLVKLYGKEQISRKDYLKVLTSEKTIQHDSEDFARKGHRKKLDTILLTNDQVARGVVLEDIDVWGYSDIEIHLVKVSEEIARLERGHRNNTLSPKEEAHYDEAIEEFRARQERLLQKKLAKIQEMDPSLGNGEDQARLMSDLSARKGLSHIEVRVYERMRDYLKAQNGGVEPDETELRMAIWAARTEIIGTGRMAAIGAMLARMPGSGDFGTASGKHVMQAPAFEDLVRTMNVEMLASRFTMGGEMGKVMQAYLRFNLRKGRIGMEKTGVGKAESFFDTDDWKELQKGIQDNSTKETIKIMQFAEKDLGIKFSEMLAPGFMGTGGQFDGTSWRLDRGVLDEIKAYYLELQKKHPKAHLDNQALAIRYLIADGPEARKQVLEKMMRRTPTKFFTLLADQREDLMKKVGLPSDDKTWYRFANALKYAETDLWSKKDLIFKDINLADRADFDKLVKPYLKTILERDGLHTTDADIDKYRKLIDALHTRLTHTGPTRVEYKTYLDGLAQEKLPLTLSLDDFNWKDADMKVLGNLAFPRRTRDIGSMDAAKDIILAFITNRDNILSPNEPREVLKQLLALKGAVNSYNTTDAAEKVVKELSRMVVEFNRDRSLWSLPGWLPGGKTAMLAMSEGDLRPDAKYRSALGKWGIRTVNAVGQATLGNLAKVTANVSVVNSVMNWIMPGWKNFSNEPFEHWPHSIAEAISWSVRFTGAHGNHWNEIKIDEFLNTMHDMGLFTEHPEYVQDLRGEFKAGFTMKALAQVRRYWWVVIVATAAVASIEEIENEKKNIKS